jgi:tRNA nucleotidyltransferase (CCA-adding enzyme)
METTTKQLKVTHNDLVDFAEQRVNLRRADVEAEREQVQRLRDRLAEHIKEHPDFALVKMLNAGSLAKGTALRTINDVDVAVYLRADAAPNGNPDLIGLLSL